MIKMYFMTSISTDFDQFSDSRCWGYVETLTDAMQEIQNDNSLDGNVMQEGAFGYLVIEEFDVGICQLCKAEWWYKWTSDIGWVATIKPITLNHIINFAIG